MTIKFDDRKQMKKFFSKMFSEEFELSLYNLNCDFLFKEIHIKENKLSEVKEFLNRNKIKVLWVSEF